MNLKYLTDKQLLYDTKKLATEEKKITVQLLHHLKEVEFRKLFCELGYQSLFKYIVDELGYSEGAASRRISAARLLKEIPEIESKIISGDLTLSNISKAADKFKQEKITDIAFKKDILATIENTSTRLCEQTLSEINSLPIEPVKQTYPLNLCVSEESYQKLEEIRGLLAHKRLNREEVFEVIFEIALEELKKRRFKTTTSMGPIASDSRYIPAGLANAVYERDKVCQKCGSKYAREINHIIPFSLGGKTELSNLNLLCRNCNQRAAIESNLHLP